jgi:hypothetical protein
MHIQLARSGTRRTLGRRTVRAEYRFEDFQMEWIFYEGVDTGYDDHFTHAAAQAGELYASASAALANLRIEGVDTAQLMPHWNGDKIHPGILFRSTSGNKVVLATLRPLASANAFDFKPLFPS